MNAGGADRVSIAVGIAVAGGYLVPVLNAHQIAVQECTAILSMAQAIDKFSKRETMISAPRIHKRHGGRLWMEARYSDQGPQVVTTQHQGAPQTGAAKAEWVQLTVLLLADVLFYFLIIPGSIVDPENFGLDEGLPPSFSPRVVAALIAVLIIYRAAQLFFGSGASLSDGALNSESEPQVALPVRAMLGMTAGLLFATVLIPLLGFFVAGAVLLVALLWLLGEKRLTRLTAFPAIVMLLIWGLFGQLLSLRLPPGMLFMD